MRFILEDKLESAKDLDRPQLTRLLNLVEGGRVGVVCVYKLDRMWRSLRDAVNLFEFFSAHGTAFHSCTEHLDNATPFGRFVFRSVASAAELERELIRERTAMAAHARARAGEWTSSTPPFGYSRDEEGRLAVVEAEADVVRLVFGLYLRMKTIQSVVDELHARGTPTRSGMWTHNKVHRLLRNRIYTGEFSFSDRVRMMPTLRIIDARAFDESAANLAAHRGRGPRSAPPTRREAAIKSVFGQYSQQLRGEVANGNLLAEDPLATALVQLRGVSD